MITIDDITRIVSKENLSALPDILKAYRLAEEAHRGVLRESGEPYITHPLNVALNLLNMEVYDKDTICAALLHDVVEDTSLTLEDIAHEINPTVAELVDGVTKMRGMKFSKESKDNANTRKILNGLNKDVRIIIIKLADRLHNMRTLEFKKNRDRRIEIAQETLDLYVPIALSIGAYRAKKELEDLAFANLNPELYQDLFNQREEILAARQGYIHDLESQIAMLLREHNIPNEVLSNVMNIYGIYKKVNQGYRIDNIYDLQYLKVLVEEVNECFQALGIVHGIISPINGRFKDYIHTPKVNFYRSLHTTGITSNGMMLKTKIRTFDMNKVAAFGVSAVWNINPNKKPEEIPRRLSIESTQEEIRRKLPFAKAVQEIDSRYKSDASFVEALKRDLLTTEHIYVMTTTSEVIELPVGTTVFDFCILTAPEMIDNLSGALVNGMYFDITRKLSNGDVVQLLVNDYGNPANTQTPYQKVKGKDNGQSPLIIL